MKQIFLSYSYSDINSRNLADYLTLNLSNLNYIINNEWSLLNNEYDFKSTITNQINKADIFLVISNRLTPSMNFELGFAYAKNKEIIVIGDANELPVYLSDVVLINRIMPNYEILNKIYNLISRETETDFKYNKLNEQMSLDVISLLEDNYRIESLSIDEFEKSVIEYFIEKGYKAQLNDNSWDVGYDAFLINPEGKNILIEIKKYSNKNYVPVSVVRQLAGTMALKNVKHGIVITSSYFSSSAKYFAEQIGIENNLKIELYTLYDLVNKI